MQSFFRSLRFALKKEGKDHLSGFSAVKKFRFRLNSIMKDFFMILENFF